jgi:uncharacterized protein
MEVVAVFGASNDESRYAYKAMEMLTEYGHQPIPVHPRETQVLGQKVYATLGQLADSGLSVETVTVYVNAAISQKFSADFIKLKPKRVIFNPGAENPELARTLTQSGIEVEDACTLVLLRSGQF